MSNKLLLLTYDNEQYLELLRAHDLPELEIVDDTPEHIARTNLWLADPPLAAPIVGHAKNLKWLQSTYAGVDKLLSASKRCDYQLTNIRDSFGPTMSEYVFSYLIARYRNHNAYQQQQEQQTWQYLNDPKLWNKRILILGTGSIGQHLAKTARLFSMKTIGVSRLGEPKAGFDECYDMSDLNNELPKADVVVSVLPKSPQTNDVFDQHRLNLLKKDVVFFNVGRGNAVDLAALNTLLIERPNMHAVLDVFKTEPLPKTEDIWQRSNVVITPHVAAPGDIRQIVEVFAENYHRWLKGADLLYQVDFYLGY